MKSVLKKTDLLKVIQIVQNIVSPRASIPILSHILLSADGGLIRISATDLEVGVNCSVAADVEEKGSITLPGKIFSEIIRSASDDSITIEGDEESVRIISGKSSFKINALPSEEFPKIPEGEKEGGFTLSQKDVKALAKKTLFAVSREESRYALNGVLLSVSSGMITAAATDGRRLSLFKKSIEDKTVEKTAIIPAKGLSELNKIAEDSAENIEVSIGDNEVLFRTKDVVLMARLIKGEFVDYERIIPKDYSIRVDLGRESFMAVLRRVAILTSDTSKLVKITVGSDRMLISASTEVGESSDEIAVDYNGEETVMAFNPEYLIDYLQNESAEDLFLDIVNPQSPVVLRPADDGGYLYIVMPLKI